MDNLISKNTLISELIEKCNSKNGDKKVSREKIFLDIDDVLLDTEGYVRTHLSAKMLKHKGTIFEWYYLDEKSSKVRDVRKIFEVMSDYSKIPFMLGAEEGLKILMFHHDVELCSRYLTKLEAESKKLLAKRLGLKISLCGPDDFYKCSVDMGGGIIVDDNTNNLNYCNADRKICFYKKDCFNGSYIGEIVFDWSELLDKLC